MKPEIKFVKGDVTTIHGSVLILSKDCLNMDDFLKNKLILQLKKLYPKSLSNLIKDDGGIDNVTFSRPKNNKFVDILCMVLDYNDSNSESDFEHIFKILLKSRLSIVIPYRFGYMPYDRWEKIYNKLIDIINANSNNIITQIIFIVKDEEMID
jgi:hypothetical protein